MKKYILYLTTIAITLLMGACSNEEIFDESDKNLLPSTGRTISLTATMPGDDNNDDPTTRVSLTEERHKISLAWEEGDQLELAFVQGETKKKGIAIIKNITDGGKKAQFDIVIPNEIKDGKFDLYGVYGGEGLDNADPTKLRLPSELGKHTTLALIKERKEVVLYFSSKGIQTVDPKVSVVFKHLGSLFCINYTYTGAKNINLRKIGFDAVGNNVSFAYRSGKDHFYNLASDKFLNAHDLEFGHVFIPQKNIMKSGETATLWAWFPPMPGVKWPALTVFMSIEISSGNWDQWKSVVNKPARTSPTAVGQAYFFHIEWDGTNNPKFVERNNIYYVNPKGSLGAILNETQRDTITTMRVKGEIDQNDFVVLSSQLPNLNYLDLSDVKCNIYNNNVIPKFAFDGNKTIKTIILPKSITEISLAAFRESALDGILNIPVGVKIIRQEAFKNSRGISGTLNIPEGLTTIEYQAFAVCKGLTGLKLPSSLKTIGHGAFNSCSNIEGTVIFPEALESIGSFAFYVAEKITAFRFPHLVPIPHTDKMLPTNKGGFIVEVPFSAVATYKTTPGWSDYNIVGYGTPSRPDEYHVPTMGTLSTILGDQKNTITKMKLTGQINSADFTVMKRQMPKLTYIDLSNVTCEGNKIPGGAFGGWDTGNFNVVISTIILPISITEIGSEAFRQCSALSGIVLPAGLTKIGSYAFYMCEKLSGTVVFPESLKTIDEWAFYIFNKNITYQFPHTGTASSPIIPYTEQMLMEGATVKVPSSSVEKYKLADGWKDRHSGNIIGY